MRSRSIRVSEGAYQALRGRATEERRTMGAVLERLLEPTSTWGEAVRRAKAMGGPQTGATAAEAETKEKRRGRRTVSDDEGVARGTGRRGRGRSGVESA